MSHPSNNVSKRNTTSMLCHRYACSPLARGAVADDQLVAVVRMVTSRRATSSPIRPDASVWIYQTKVSATPWYQIDRRAATTHNVNSG
jgi:hypothetical protein